MGREEIAKVLAWVLLFYFPVFPPPVKERESVPLILGVGVKVWGTFRTFLPPSLAPPRSGGWEGLGRNSRLGEIIFCLARRLI